MEYLYDGIREFNNKDFLEHQDLFQEIGKRQNPHTLFIGCSDSRVVPNMITQTLPGELFVIRNIANLVPMYRQTDEFVATTSAIEYAVKILKVENIVVCGHSNCGGCKALFMNDEMAENIPHTKKWLELADSVKKRILCEGIIDPVLREWKTEQLNIVQQMNHLLSYPYIKERSITGELNILGWYYIIETGEVFNYNKELRIFERIE